jgi:hypothetical protein
MTFISFIPFKIFWIKNVTVTNDTNITNDMDATKDMTVTNEYIGYILPLYFEPLMVL